VRASWARNPWGAIESWIPLFCFVILFGLSMDYHVVVVSRIREAHDRGLPTQHAIAHGIRISAGVVTSAAAIMVGVFAIFGTLSLTAFKQLGVGLAVAILLDATIVRAVLLPSLLSLLGERTWWLPRWLSFLPEAAPVESGTPPESQLVDEPEPAVRELHSASTATRQFLGEGTSRPPSLRRSASGQPASWPA
jgi:uncharacterized membrane protein YdfJ with MMPL/SSD domain